MRINSFTLLRHGQVSGGPALYGHTDVALSAQGNDELERAMENIHAQLAVESITTSPLIRCATIANKFSKDKKIPLQIEPQLKEMNFGLWDGMLFDNMGDTWQPVERFFNSPFLIQPPEGETLAFFARRVIAAWEEITQKNTGQHHLLVCHGGVIKIIIAHILQIDWRNANFFQQLQIDYASNTRIEIGCHRGALPVVKWVGVN